MPPRPSPAAEQLVSEIGKALPFLFARHGAETLSSQLLPGFGNAQVFVRVQDLTLRFLLTLGSVDVLVAPHHTPNEWHSMDMMLVGADPSAKFPRRPVFGSLAELGTLLEPRLLLLNEALSKQRLTETVERSRQILTRSLIGVSPPMPQPPSLGLRSLLGAFRVIPRVVRFLTPKSKDNWKNLLPIGSDDALEGKVRDEFRALFEKYGASVTSNGRYPTMDHAVVAFDASNLRFRVVRDRGDLDVSLAPLLAIRDWHPLGLALMVTQPGADGSNQNSSSRLRGAGSLVEREFPMLNEAYSVTRYRATCEQLRQKQKELEIAWIEEWNRTNPHMPAKVGG
ncbi:MAG TPA: hypothetical protein VEG64_11020 [Candidatus Sulfotelmatobacter sp.]|nr:hypothetical protein [Candidatus Sulfotelmatobacter sp.]